MGESLFIDTARCSCEHRLFGVVDVSIPVYLAQQLTRDLVLTECVDCCCIGVSSAR